jgi:hypothetical protein
VTRQFSGVSIVILRVILVFSCWSAIPVSSGLGQQAASGGLEGSVRKKVIEAFAVDPSAIQEDVAVFMTRALTSAVVGEVINRSKASVQYTLPSQASYVPEPVTIKTADLPDAHQDCSRDNFCIYGCDQQWPWEKFGCEVARETCKDTQKFDCERRKTMAQVISDQELATVSFKEATVTGTVSASRLHASLSSALDSVAITAALSASLTVSCSGYLTPTFVIGALPLFIGLPPCVKHEFGFTNEPVEINESDLHLNGKVDLNAEGDDVVVQVRVEKPTVTLHFAGTPVLRLLARKPLAFMACSVPYTLAAITNVTHPNDTAKKEVQVPVPDKSTRIGKLTVAVSGLEVTRSAKVTEKAVGVVASLGGK